MCGCVPWNYPHIEDEIKVICDGERSFCFDEAMATVSEECQLTPDCEETQYTLYSYKYNLNSERECTIKNKVLRMDAIQNGSELPPLTSDPVNQYDLLSLVGEKLR